MFYSHEILTSRKYGVATVWLVATLGSKSSLKRINRKQILEVDVSRACQTIVDPAAPMALRLQGNLLYGVSRVYLQQCGYLLSDAQNAQIALRTMLRTVHDAALDTAAGKARPGQLILEDDPSFLPELAPPPPELLAELNSNFNLDIPHSGDSQSLTPFGTQQSGSSSNAGNIDGLILPTSSPVAAGEFRLESDHALGSVSRPSGMLAAGDTINIEDPDFMFGDDGEIIQLSPGTTVPKIPAMPIGTTMPSDAVLSARVRREHKEGQQASIQVPGDETDIGLPSYDDGLPEVGASSASTLSQSNQHSEVVESSDTVTAPMRRRRVPRTIVADTITELRNKDLANWNTDYLDNMRTAARQKVQNRSMTQAKKNAEYYVWGSGLGAVSQRIFSNRGSNPFDMFIGDKLFESITGMSRTVTGVKHDRDSGIDDTTQGESRHVRQKTGDFETARATEDEGFFMPSGGDDVAVEMPREAASALDDQQIFSAMPWNMSASIRGSSAVPRSGRMGMISSADQGRHGSRLVSASPLHGRGPAILLEDLKDLTSDAGYADDEFGLPGLSSDLPEPTVPLNTTSRFCEALSAEGENFIKFVNEQISEKHSRIEADPEAVTSTGTITFEELLPPIENTKMVACQGLMIVLALGTKGMLDVQQHDHLGDIHLKPSEKVLQTIEISDGEESEESEDEGTPKEYPAMTLPQTASEFEDPDEEMERADDLEGGHFQEQFAAGHAAQEEDDGDSLYAD